MIVKSFELEKLKSLNFNMHLIYGVNEGIQQYIIENFYLKNFDGELLKYDEQEIFNKREEFISSLLTKSLFTNNKLVIILEDNLFHCNIYRHLYQPLLLIFPS